jgi:hypothetical protein
VAIKGHCRPTAVIRVSTASTAKRALNCSDRSPPGPRGYITADLRRLVCYTTLKPPHVLQKSRNFVSHRSVSGAARPDSDGGRGRKVGSRGRSSEMARCVLTAALCADVRDVN